MKNKSSFVTEQLKKEYIISDPTGKLFRSTDKHRLRTCCVLGVVDRTDFDSITVIFNKNKVPFYNSILLIANHNSRGAAAVPVKIRPNSQDCVDMEITIVDLQILHPSISPFSLDESSYLTKNQIYTLEFLCCQEYERVGNGTGVEIYSNDNAIHSYPPEAQ